MITGFVDFYDQRVKDELSYFTEKFESATDTLCSFMALKKKEDLLQTIATLINFDNKHSQYISQILEAKLTKDRMKHKKRSKPSIKKNPFQNDYIVDMVKNQQ